MLGPTARFAKGAEPMTDLIRRLRHGLLAVAILGVAACTHTPQDPHLKGPVVVPPGDIPGENLPPADPTAAYPVPFTPPGAQTGEAITAEEPTPVVGLTPAQYGDLFDRVRAGFLLDEVNRRPVEQQVNWYARNPEYLERAFARSELYLYHIVAEIESRGMPLELALLPMVESAFEPYAYSHARASGMWQFIPGTGSRFGLKQNWWYDGRRDVVESTRAALDYLQYLHDEFDGDWLLAIAGYNCGEAAVARAIAANRRAGRPTDFWSLKLPSETRAYVPKLLAMKRLVANPETYGLAFSPIVNQAYFTRVETLGQIDLKLAAEISGVTYEELYELNPAFHRWATDPTGPHYLLLPADGAEVFRQNIAQLTVDERMRVTRHVVESGESIASVAKQFNTTNNVIRDLNGLPEGPLVVGAELRVPSTMTALPPKVARAAARVDGPDRRTTRRPHLHVVRGGDSLWSIAKKHGMNVKTLAAMNSIAPGATLRAGQRLKLSGVASTSSTTKTGTTTTASTGVGRSLTYTVRSGDTLSAIARLFQVSVNQIVNWNSISTKSSLRPGQRLTIHVAGRQS